MVKRLFRFLNKETGGLHEAAYLLGLFALFSQVLAFLRDRLLAHIFGASESLDIYYAAFRIPDFIFVTAASIVSISVLVPFIIEKDRLGKEEVRKFVESIFTFFSLLIIASCALAYLLIPHIAGLIFKGFSPESLEQVIFVSRILLISPLALGFSNLFGSITQAYNRFTIYAFAPLLYNIGIIFGIIILGRELGIVGVAIGVVTGAVLHMGVQIPFVVKTGLFPTRPNIDFAYIKKVVALSLPRTLTLSTNNLVILFLVSFASLMATGSISVLSLSINLSSVPLSIIGVSYSLAAFPTLSRHFADKNISAFITQIAATARHIIFWSLPLTALFIVIRAQVVRVLLGTGQFSWSDTRLTAAALAIFVASAVFQSLLILFMRGFYSAGHTKKPFVINLASTIVLVASTYALVKMFYASREFSSFVSNLFKVGDLANTAVLMLPLGFSLGVTINALAHWIWFEREFKGFSKEVLRTFSQSFLASVVIGIVSYAGLVVLAPMFATQTLIGIFFQGFLAGIMGIIAGVLALYALNSQELREVWRAIHAKFWKSKVIATDPEIV